MNRAEQIEAKKIRPKETKTRPMTPLSSRARLLNSPSQLPRRRNLSNSLRLVRKMRKKRRTAEDVVAVADAVGADEEVKANQKKARQREKHPRPKTRRHPPSSSNSRPVIIPSLSAQEEKAAEIAEVTVVEATVAIRVMARKESSELGESRGRERVLPAMEVIDAAAGVTTDAAVGMTTVVVVEMTTVVVVERTVVVVEVSVATEDRIEEAEEVAAVEMEHKKTSHNNSSLRNRKRKANQKIIERLR